MKHIFYANKWKIVALLVLLFIIWNLSTNGIHNFTSKKKTINTDISTPSLLEIGVYYEALCPDSKNFIVKQLYPLFAQAPEILKIQFYPYGKATTNINQDGSLSFECQHGHTECVANMYHACSIESIHDAQTLLNVIKCMIADNMDPKKAMLKCAKTYHIDSEPIQKCFDSTHSLELLKMHGEATNSLRPPVSFIPTVTLDGNQRKQASILKDLRQSVCEVFKEKNELPNFC